MMVLRKFGLLMISALALGALLLGGCQRMKELGEDFDPRLRPEDQNYQFVIDGHLAKDSIYDGPATDAHFVALPLGMTVRKAMAARKALAFGLTKAEAAKRLAEQQQANQEALEVVVSVFLPERKWNDLASQNPTFRAYMIGDKGQRVEPFDRRLIKDRSSIHETLYFFWGPWSKLYLLRFPKNAAGGQPVVVDNKSTLIMTGPPGQAKLRLLWD
jgi:hypothetical protein